MDKLTITCAIDILNRLPTKSIHNIASVLIMNNHNARGWERAVNTCRLFRKNYMHMVLASDSVMISLWKEIFPEYPQLYLSYEKNFAAYVMIIKPEIVIQKAIDTLELDAPFINAMREFRTPTMSYGMLEAFLQCMLIHHVDIPKLLDVLIYLHDWPKCFSNDNNSISSDDFWKLATNHLENLLEYWRTTSIDIYTLYVVSTRNFLGKYVDNIDWTKHRLYQCLNEEFFTEHPEICIRVKWTNVLTNVQLGEKILGEIMESANAGEKYYGQNLNVAYIASNQQLSEEFIETWIVDKKYDQDHIWSNIFRYQTLSDDFKEKYKYKRPITSTTALRSMLTNMSSF